MHINAGMLIRKDVRRFLLENAIKFHEDKSWLDSVFYLRDTPARNTAVIRALRPWFDQE